MTDAVPLRVLRRLDPRHEGALVTVYRDAYAAAPYRLGAEEVAGFAETLRRHALRRGFKAVVAEREGAVVGFAYGYSTAPDGWWHDIVARELGEALAREWLTDSFELVHLAVVPDAQGVGVGTRLHDALLEGVPHARAVLSTAAGETAASRLYGRRGWRTLLDDVTFPGSGLRYRVMGVRLS